MCGVMDGEGGGGNAQSTMAVISGRGERERGLCVFSLLFSLRLLQYPLLSPSAAAIHNSGQAMCIS